jgi:hypothetical protein
MKDEKLASWDANSLLESMEEQDLSYASVPEGLKKTVFDPERHHTGSVIVDDNVAEDMMHGVYRERAGYSSFPLLNLVGDFADEVDFFLDHSVLDGFDTPSYDEASMIQEDVREDLEGYLRAGTWDLAVDEWAEMLDMEGDDLYLMVSYYQDSPIITYDADLQESPMALTPRKYASGMRKHY